MANNTRFKNDIGYNKSLGKINRDSIESIISTHRDEDGTFTLTLNTVGEMLKKDPTTISKEVKKHREVHYSNIVFRPARKELLCQNCSKAKTCNKKNDYLEYLKKTPILNQIDCSDFQRALCKHLTHFPWVCNGCPKRGHCHMTHYYYNSNTAHKEYKEILSECRSGINMTQREYEQMMNIIMSGLEKGQSIDTIVVNNRESIPVSTRSIYYYIEKCYPGSPKPIDCRRMPKLKPRANKHPNSIVIKEKKRGHLYSDFLNYMSEHLDANVCQMDTVEGRKGEPLILTLHLLNIHFQFFFLVPSKEAIDIVNTLNNVRRVIGNDDYQKLFGLILTDNGTEFSDVDGIRFDDETGELKSELFFCDPTRSDQKGSCERNHELLRYVFPKKTSFANLTQDDLNLTMSHVNSYIRKSTDYSTPIELFCAHYGSDILDKLNVKRIPANDVILKPELIK